MGAVATALWPSEASTVLGQSLSLGIRPKASQAPAWKFAVLHRRILQRFKTL
jgi:hypothetical protein